MLNSVGANAHPCLTHFLQETVQSTFHRSGPVQACHCHKSTVWLDSSMVRVHARYVRGPGFEFRTGHVLFPPL